ncbi:hypothetical protein [Streptomyces sp. 1222.5]|uniref:hypothetical protein n=1 Tax=Streptomyces sp. 1222.5 TaxID=1881026 RepID=UPI003EB8F32B
MTDRNQARAMDLPDYPCPPTVGQIGSHAGSWGWFSSAHIAQDDNGYLWIESKARPLPTRTEPTRLKSLAAWTEQGIALYTPPSAYQVMGFLTSPVDELEWAPVASILKEPPGYATDSADL